MEKITLFILRFRIQLVVAILLTTIVMGYYASKVEMSYEFGNRVPADDTEMIFFRQFKGQFGEDANIIGVGLRDSSIYSLENFNHFLKLNKAVKMIPE